MAIHTVVRFFDGWGMIPFSVELRGKFEDALRAEFNAITAPLTAIIENIYLPM